MPTDPTILFNEATQLAKAGQKTEALIRLRRLLLQKPTHISALMYLAWLTPDVHEGMAALEKVLTLDIDAGMRSRAEQGLSELRTKPAEPTVFDQPISVETIAPPAPARAEPPAPLPAGDSITQARAVIWPFRKLNRSIGDLLNEGQITAKDLRWAAGNDRRVSAEVRAAAQTLLVAQPQPVKVVTDTHAQPDLAEAVAAARQVIWPYRHMHRPMGELLDQGKITAKDLEYASHRGGPSVRLAAQILLQSLPKDAAPAVVNSAPATEMTLAEAQLTFWPYRKLNRPMGELLAKGKIAPKDLQYAIDHAKDEVAEAAQLLLDQASTEAAIQAEATGKLEEPVPMTPPSIVPRADGSLIVVGSSDFMKHNQFIGRLKALAGVLFSDSLFEEGVDQYTTHKRGERGEEEVVRELTRLLDKRWKLYRNLILPDSDADLDAVLIGPTGVMLLEIKAYTGSFRVRGSEWSYRQGSRWRPMDKNPTQQAQWNRQRLARYLQDRVHDNYVPVSAMIVLGREPQYLKIIRPTVYVAHLNKLTEGLKSYLAQPVLPEKIIKGIRSALDRLI